MGGGRLLNDGSTARRDNGIMAGKSLWSWGTPTPRILRKVFGGGTLGPDLKDTKGKGRREEGACGVGFCQGWVVVFWGKRNRAVGVRRGAPVGPRLFPYGRLYGNNLLD